MKIVSKREECLSNIELYDLNDAYAANGKSVGLTLCYTLAADEQLGLISLEFTSQSEEMGVPEPWYRSYQGDTFSARFPAIEPFYEAFDRDDFAQWTVHTTYQGAELQLSGTRSETVVKASYQKECKVNLLPLLVSAESATYRYHGYDRAVVAQMKERFRITDRTAVGALQKLEQQPDIFAAFSAALTSGQDDGLCVEGHTADKLVRTYALSTLGAYQFLCYLRQSPEEAKRDLLRGLPRK